MKRQPSSAHMAKRIIAGGSRLLHSCSAKNWTAEPWLAQVLKNNSAVHEMISRSVLDANLLVALIQLNFVTNWPTYERLSVGQFYLRRDSTRCGLERVFGDRKRLQAEFLGTFFKSR